MVFGMLGLGGLTLPSGAQTPEHLNQNFLAMERDLEEDFESYFGEDLAEVTQAPDAVSATLQRLATQTGSRAGVLWVIPRQELLHLVLLTPGGSVIVKDFDSIPRDRILPVVQAFKREISDPSLDPKSSKVAKQLYDWIIAPYAEELKAQNIDSLLFCLGNGMRGLPLAALQDEEGQYLIEHYSVTSIPAFNLIDTDYEPLRQGKILAAGASQFSAMNPLPAVPVELDMVQSALRDTPVAAQGWQGRSLLNETFTTRKLKSELKTHPFNIVHLATHAEFLPGRPKQSYIQFQNKPLRLSKMGRVKWPKALDLLVLSACQTALGDPEAELGFAGIALKSRVKSAMGSLWSVSDVGTLALMSEFYHQLPQASTKAIALQQAQLKLLRGDIHVAQDELRTQRGPTSLPKAIALGQSTNFAHPYFWAGFTLLSSPW